MRPLAFAGALALAAAAGATPIPNDPFAAPVPTFVGRAARPRRVSAPAVPQDPFMAPNGRSNVLDNQDRAVMPTNSHQIWVVGETTTAAGPAFELVRIYDLSTIVEPSEGIISCLPDWSGLLWFVTVNALVGTVDPASGAVETMRLAGEAIGNSFAVDETGGVVS